MVLMDLILELQVTVCESWRLFNALNFSNSCLSCISKNVCICIGESTI